MRSAISGRVCRGSGRHADRDRCPAPNFSHAPLRSIANDAFAQMDRILHDLVRNRPDGGDGAEVCAVFLRQIDCAGVALEQVQGTGSNALQDGGQIEGG